MILKRGTFLILACLNCRNCDFLFYHFHKISGGECVDRIFLNNNVWFMSPDYVGSAFNYGNMSLMYLVNAFLGSRMKTAASMQ